MINYQHIQDSIEYYEKSGFARIESPWTVTRAVSRITAPAGAFDWEINGKDKVLVASGEQSFLYLYLKGFLPKGQFQTVTPCFRNEPFDETHTKYFLKNELIITEDPTSPRMHDLVHLAEKFFQQYIPKKHIDSVRTQEGWDLVFKKRGVTIELGSYGLRQCSFLKWIYGTGCAEPRLSQAMQHGIPQSTNRKRTSWRVLQNPRGV